jgi:glycerate kinase
MKIVVASDKWKQSLEAPEACAAIACGLRHVFPEAEIHCKPIADGGEGLVAAVLRSVPAARSISARVPGPRGDPVEAAFALLPDATAVLEMAGAAGLALLAGRALDPWRSNTLGVGELMWAATAAGARTIIVGLGGSATNDAGGGMAQSLGWTLDGVRHWPGDWRNLRGIKPPAQRFPAAVVAACDVASPLFGPRGCTRMFGPQKGIVTAEFEHWDAALEKLARCFPPELAARSGAGAAGGLGWGLLAFCDATIVPGFDVVAGIIQLDDTIASADLVVTGEGSLDAQTLNGKGPHGVAGLARHHGKKVVAIGGRVTPEARAAFDLCVTATPPDMPLEQALPRAGELIQSSICAARGKLLGLVP